MSRIRVGGSGRTIIKAGSLFSPRHGFIPDRYLLLNNGIIEWIDGSIPPFTDADILDFPGSVISPPFCDYHLHFSKGALDLHNEITSCLIAHGILTAFEGGDKDLSGKRIKDP